MGSDEPICVTPSADSQSDRVISSWVVVLKVLADGGLVRAEEGRRDVTLVRAAEASRGFRSPLLELHPSPESENNRALHAASHVRVVLDHGLQKELATAAIGASRLRVMETRRAEIATRRPFAEPTVCLQNTPNSGLASVLSYREQFNRLKRKCMI